MAEGAGPSYLSLIPKHAIPAPTAKHPNRVAYVTLSADDNFTRWSLSPVHAFGGVGALTGSAASPYQHVKIVYRESIMVDNPKMVRGVTFNGEPLERDEVENIWEGTRV